MMETYGHEERSTEASFNIITATGVDQQETFQFQQQTCDYQDQNQNSEETFYKQPVANFDNNNNHEYQQNHQLDMQQYHDQAFSNVPPQPPTTSNTTNQQQDNYSFLADQNCIMMNHYQTTTQNSHYEHYNDDESNYDIGSIVQQVSLRNPCNQAQSPPGSSSAGYYDTSVPCYQQQQQLQQSQQHHQQNIMEDLQNTHYHQQLNHSPNLENQPTYYLEQTEPVGHAQQPSAGQHATNSYASLDSSDSYESSGRQLVFTTNESFSQEICNETRLIRSSEQSDLSLVGKLARPRKRSPRSKSDKINGKLWEFIRDLLLSDRTNPSFIRWERREDGVFKFVQSDKVAKMWGERKQNPKMTYEKLSRAMRYYYKSKVLLPVFGRRLVYKFGPNATGWKPEVYV